MKSAKEGVIVISFGIVANASAMPSNMLQAFVEAIRRMPDHRFYMRIGSDMLPGYTMDELPPNLNITRHLPQLDLLGFASFFHNEKLGTDSLDELGEELTPDYNEGEGEGEIYSLSELGLILSTVHQNWI